MRRMAAATTLISFLSVASTSVLDNPGDRHVTCGELSETKLILNIYYDRIGPDRINFGKVVRFDTDCDGFHDLVHIFNNESKPDHPVMYFVRGDASWLPPGYYFDPIEDWFNGNEIKCKNLEDCLDKLFSEDDSVEA